MVRKSIQKLIEVYQDLKFTLRLDQVRNAARYGRPFEKTFIFQAIQFQISICSFIITLAGSLIQGIDSLERIFHGRSNKKSS